MRTLFHVFLLGHLENVKTIIQNGGDVNILDASNRTPLALALADKEEAEKSKASNEILKQIGTFNKTLFHKDFFSIHFLI